MIEMGKHPYKYWDRDELYSHLKRQATANKYFDYKTIRYAVYDTRWNPMLEFNGCNVVQDDLHPFLPCFLHDYRWVVKGGGKKTDIQFYNSLIKFGVPKWKAKLYYYRVRIGWNLYFKHKK